MKITVPLFYTEKFMSVFRLYSEMLLQRIIRCLIKPLKQEGIAVHLNKEEDCTYTIEKELRTLSAQIGMRHYNILKKS